MLETSAYSKQKTERTRFTTMTEKDWDNSDWTWD